MSNYKFLKKGPFESLEKFEKKLNEQVKNGWKAISHSDGTIGIVVMLYRDR